MRDCANSTPLQDRQPAAAWFKVLNMHGSTHLSTWVSAGTKQRFGELARQTGLSESSLLRRMVELTLNGTLVAEAGAFPSSRTRVGRDARLYVRLRPEDHLLLRERARRSAAVSETRCNCWRGMDVPPADAHTATRRRARAERVRSRSTNSRQQSFARSSSGVRPDGVANGLRRN